MEAVSSVPIADGWVSRSKFVLKASEIWGRESPVPVSGWDWLTGIAWKVHHQPGGPLAGPLRVSMLHLMTLGTQAIHFSHGEPHCGSISENAVVSSRPLEHAGFLNSGHTWPRHIDKNSLVSKHVVSILSTKNSLQRIPLVAIISKKPLKYK